jgi:hypothetical protein
MRVLLDECLPKRLKRELPAHEVCTVPEMGWAGIKNGALIRLAEQQFDVFLTMDRNLEFQQNIKQLRLAIAVLCAPSNEIQVLRPLMPLLQETLTTIQNAQLVHVGR